MIRNPIIRRELLSALRTRKALLMQGAFLLTTAVLFLLYWPAGGLQDIGGQEARQIFGILAIGELVMVVLFAPAFTAAALTSEREHNTLESLFATPMRPWEIAVGKMVGSLGFLVLVILSGVPMLAMPFLLGGVEGSQLLAVIGILLVTAVYLGMIGLLVSALGHRSYRAIITAYALLLIVCFLLALPATPLSNHMLRRAGPTLRPVWHVLASFSPLEAMLSLVWAKHSWAGGDPNMPAFWMLFLPLSALTTLVIAAVCLIKLRRPAGPPRPRERLKVVERGQISARTFLFIIDPRKRKRMIGWWQNPMLVKEFRTRPMLQAQWLLRAIGWCIIISIVLMIIQAQTIQIALPERPSIRVIVEDLPAVIAALSIIVIVLVGPAITGGTLCSDREAGVWDLIRTTHLSSWRIVSGKLQSAVIPLLLLVLAMLPTLIVLPFLVSFEVDLWPTILRILVVVVMAAVFVAAAGMFFSGLCAKTATATAWTYGLVISIALLTLLMLVGEGRFSQRVVGSVFVVSPLAAALDAAGNPDMRRYALMRPHLLLMGAATAFMLLVSVVRVVQLRRPDR
jgi:ABC-type transport system involved in multi-copper enzyme maturation permease subunit